MEKRPRPDLTLPRFSRIITRNSNNVFLASRWVKKGWLEFIPGNPRLIHRSYALSIFRALRQTMKIGEMAEMVGVTSSWIGHQVRKGLIQTEKVLVFRRIPKTEIPKARRLWQKAQKEIVHPGKNGFARYSSHKQKKLRQLARASNKGRSPITQEERKASALRLKQLHQEGRIPYLSTERVRKLAQARVKTEKEGTGTSRVLPIAFAAKLLGLPVSKVREMARSGTIRSVRVGEDKYLPYFASVNTYRGNHKRWRQEGTARRQE